MYDFRSQRIFKFFFSLTHFFSQNITTPPKKTYSKHGPKSLPYQISNWQLTLKALTRDHSETLPMCIGQLVFQGWLTPSFQSRCCIMSGANVFQHDVQSSDLSNVFATNLSFQHCWLQCLKHEPTSRLLLVCQCSFSVLYISQMQNCHLAQLWRQAQAKLFNEPCVKGFTQWNRLNFSLFSFYLQFIFLSSIQSASAPVLYSVYVVSNLYLVPLPTVTALSDLE